LLAGRPAGGGGGASPRHGPSAVQQDGPRDEPRSPCAGSVAECVAARELPIGVVDCAVVPRAVPNSTVLVPRPLLSPAAARGLPADYIRYDNSPSARVRARLRLCASLLDDHLELRHQLAVGDQRRERRCLLCGAVGSRNTVQHVFLQCEHPPLAEERTAVAAALRALALDLDLHALAGVADGSDDRRAAAVRATARLLGLVRELLVF
jgi:hypothetical protein